MEKKFIYNGTIILETDTDEIPKCKICGSDLNYKKTNGRLYRVTNCTNPQCSCFNTNKIKIKRLSFLGEEYADKLEKEKRKKNPLCIEYWINKGYSEEESKQIISEKQKKYSQISHLEKNRITCSKELMLKKMSPEEVNLFFKRRSKRCIEYWTSRGYSEEEAKKNISKLQSECSKNANNDIEKVRKRSWRCPEYWMLLSGVTLEEAKQIISEKQKFFSKEKCIEKYGKIDGIKKWEERQRKWQESLHKSKNLHVGFSKISQKLFDEILSYYQEEEKDYVFYGSKNREFSIRYNNINYIYDFTDLKRRKIIEFQGDIYHGNPELFTETDRPHPFYKDKTSKDLWEFDEKKKNIAINNGFSIFYVWENAYRKNKKEIKDQILKFLELC